MAINFFNQDIHFTLNNKRKVKKWIKDIITSHGYKIDTINYIFCSDPKILEINIQYLNHNYYTDIITFPLTEEDIISADIFISVETVKSNAKKFNTNFSDELNRVIIHGVLHLLGFNDYTDEEKHTMRANEDKYLHFLESL